MSYAPIRMLGTVTDLASLPARLAYPEFPSEELPLTSDWMLKKLSDAGVLPRSTGSSGEIVGELAAAAIPVSAPASAASRVGRLAGAVRRAASRGTTVSLRGGKTIEDVVKGAKTLDELVELARNNEHIISSSQKKGFVGAPPGIKSLQDLQKYRQRLKQELIRANQLAPEAPEWYDRSAEMVRRAMPQDPETLAGVLAAFSPRMTPKVNFDTAMEALAQHALGREIKPVGALPVPVQKAKDVFAGRELTGEKISAFRSGVKEGAKQSLQSVNDVHMLRGMGYKRLAASPREHAFMNAEQALLADFANTVRLGGRDDWTLKKVQAQLWVPWKAEFDLSKVKNPTEADRATAYARAMSDFGKFMKRQPGYVFSDVVPSEKSGHLLGLAENPLSREYMVRSFETQFPGGRNPIFDILGYPHFGVQPSASGLMTRTMVGLPGSGLRPAVRDVLQVAAALEPAFRGGAGKWLAVVPESALPTGMERGLLSGVLVPRAGQASEGMMHALRSLAGGTFPELVDTGEGVLLYGASPEGLKGWLRANEDVVERLAGAVPERAYVEAGFAPPAEFFRPDLAGSGRYTRALLRLLRQDPGLYRRLNEERLLAQILGEQAEIDAAMARAAGLPLRADLQTFRRIAAERPEGWLDALRAALAQGEALPGLAVGVGLGGAAAADGME